MKVKSFFEVLTAAVNDFIENGFDSKRRLDSWSIKLKAAAIGSMVSDKQMQAEIEKALGAAFTRTITKSALEKQGISKFNIEKLKPKLRKDLDRRIMASANLIKLNREQAIYNTLRRFQGWATSIPVGGTKSADRIEQKDIMRRDVSKINFIQRRVVVDQTHKLVASIREVVALDAGAIAFVWKSHYRQAGYDYREDHKERNDKIYIVRDSSASKAGLVKAIDGYYDEITAPGEEINCRCFSEGIYNLRELPEKFLTQKGIEQLQSRKRE